MAFHTYLRLSRVKDVVGNRVIWKDGTENAVPTSQISGISHRIPSSTANMVINVLVALFFFTVSPSLIVVNLLILA